MQNKKIDQFLTLFMFMSNVIEAEQNRENEQYSFYGGKRVGKISRNIANTIFVCLALSRSRPPLDDHSHISFI